MEGGGAGRSARTRATDGRSFMGRRCVPLSPDTRSFTSVWLTSRHRSRSSVRSSGEAISLRRSRAKDGFPWTDVGSRAAAGKRFCCRRGRCSGFVLHRRVAGVFVGCDIRSVQDRSPLRLRTRRFSRGSIQRRCVTRFWGFIARAARRPCRRPRTYGWNSFSVTLRASCG